MTTAAWTDQHVAAAPTALRERIRQLAAASGAASDTPAALARVAHDTLNSVIGGPGDRSSALDLLAADALITLALLAQAQSHPSQLGELAVELLSMGRTGA